LRPSQAYTHFARAAVQLDRAGAAQARATVGNVLGSALRFLGFRRNVERTKGPSSLMEVLDGEALARYVSFALTVRYAACARALVPPCRHAPTGRAAAASRAASAQICPTWWPS